jgi:hypothetical protein
MTALTSDFYCAIPFVTKLLHWHGCRVSVPLDIEPSYSCAPSDIVHPLKVKGFLPVVSHSPLYLRARCRCDVLGAPIRKILRVCKGELQPA